MKNKGYFVISLDFELMWGMFDKVTIDSYGENLTGVYKAIPELLKLFVEYDIHATWAPVGMLMFDDIDTLRTNLLDVNLRPRYKNPALSSYSHLETESDSIAKNSKFYFAPELIQLIIDTPGQELGSHTFSHYYCLEGGENSKAIFAADCQAMQTATKRFGTTPTSIIFPRNQVTSEALNVCKEAGLKTYRGTESHFLYRARKETSQTNPVIRILRLLDHYLNLTGHHTYPVPKDNGGLINLPASRFFRPYTPTLKYFESLRLRRIKNAMTRAAQNGEVFHLWWHPHNFGINRKENLKNLLVIFGHYQKLQTEYGMQSKNMQELSTLAAEQSAAMTVAD